MKIRYASIDTSTLKGLKKAERLQARGWTIFRVGLSIIQFKKAEAK